MNNAAAPSITRQNEGEEDDALLNRRYKGVTCFRLAGWNGSKVETHTHTCPCAYTPELSPYHYFCNSPLLISFLLLLS